MRRFILVGSGVLLLVASVYFTVAHLRPGPFLAFPNQFRPPPPAEPELVLPPLPESNPDSPFTAQEQTILWYLGRGRADRESKWSMAIAARDERAFREAGGDSPAAFPFYLRLLNMEWNPERDWHTELKILDRVARIPGDRSAFRQPAGERLKHPKPGVVKGAIRLLKEIGTPAEAATVAGLIETYEADRPDDRFFEDVAYAVLDALTAIGTEAEIRSLEKSKANNYLWGNKRFWEKAEECKKAIRARLTKEKEQAGKK